jgi:hypothetical protein
VSCTAPILIETDNSEPVIVIYGVLDDSLRTQQIFVSRSAPYFDTAANVGVSGATVTVTASDGAMYAFVENDTVAGSYLSVAPFKAEAGETYALRVSVDFDGDGAGELYEASAKVAPVAPIDSIAFESLNMYGHKNYTLLLYFTDPPDTNYYLFHVHCNDSLLTARMSRHIVSDDALFNGQFTTGRVFRFDDVSERDKDSEEQQEYSAYLQAGDRVQLTLCSISQGYFDFITQCKQERNGEMPVFGGPASNITTNISNGGLGYFAGYCSSSANLVFE